MAAANKKVVIHWGPLLNPVNTKLQSEINLTPEKFGEVGWYRVVLKTTVRETSSLESTILSFLLPGKTVHVIQVEGRRAEIDLPINGWVSMTSSSGDAILEAVSSLKDKPMPSEIFGDAFAKSPDYDEIVEDTPDVINKYIEDRTMMENFLGKTIEPEAIFERFSLSESDDLHKIQFLYGATVSAFASLKLGGHTPILKRNHVEGVVNRFVEGDYFYGWADIEQRLSRVLNDYDLFVKSEDAIPWEIAPLARASQEFVKKIAKRTESLPDALRITNVAKRTDGVYQMSGYFNQRPLYVRKKCGERVIRWFSSEDLDAWFIDVEAKNDEEGIARLEVSCPHPGVRTKSKWLIYDEVTASWRRSSRIRIMAITFSSHAL